MNVLQKKVIYLDQNFISDIAKMSLEDKKDKVNPEFKKIFDIIKIGVKEERFLSPKSWIHEQETAAEKNQKLREAIRSHQGFVGQVELKPSWEIKNAQFYNALLAYFNIKNEKEEFWKEAFRDNPDKRMENFKIEVHMPDIGLSKLLPETLNLLQEIRESDVNEHNQYKLEVSESRKYYKKLLLADFSWVLKKYSITPKQAEEFIDSDEFLEIPNIYIFCKLWSRILSDKNRKRGIEGDYNDVEFLSLYMPYCQVIATDHYMKIQVESLQIDRQYECKLFSMRESGLQDLNSYLEQLKKDTPPANQSLFSVLAVMEGEKLTFPIEFLQKLQTAKSKFQNTGKYWNKNVYTEVFLLYPDKTEVKMPTRKDVRANGPAAFTPDQWSEFLIFGQGFKKIINDEDKSIEEIINDIQPHLRGSATAIINESDSFDNDVREHDSYLFYDIERAIKFRKEHTERYGVRIIYPKISANPTPPAT